MQRLVFLCDNSAISLADIDDALIPTVRAADGGPIMIERSDPALTYASCRPSSLRHYMLRALKASGNRIPTRAALVGTSRQNFSKLDARIFH